MMKECFAQEFTDAEKFRECTTCPIAEECVRTVYLRNARGAAALGQALGLLAGLAAALYAAFSLADAPRAAGWGLLLSLLYLVAVFRAGKEYAAANREEVDSLRRQAEAR
jgi:hypothetical protein